VQLHSSYGIVPWFIPRLDYLYCRTQKGVAWQSICWEKRKEKKSSLAGSRTPLSRDHQRMTGACTEPIYYQGLVNWLKIQFITSSCDRAIELWRVFFYRPMRLKAIGYSHIGYRSQTRWRRSFSYSKCSFDNKAFSQTLLLPKTKFPLRADIPKSEAASRSKICEELYLWQVSVSVIGRLY
jgi:hypothetical protein